MRTCYGPGCLEHGQFKCVKCQVVYYCGKNCQTQHWSQHKIICKEVRHVYDIIKDVYNTDETWFLTGSTAAITLHLRLMMKGILTRIFPGYMRAPDGALEPHQWLVKKPTHAGQLGRMIDLAPRVNERHFSRKQYVVRKTTAERIGSTWSREWLEHNEFETRLLLAPLMPAPNMYFENGWMAHQYKQLGKKKFFQLLSESIVTMCSGGSLEAAVSELERESCRHRHNCC